MKIDTAQIQARCKECGEPLGAKSPLVILGFGQIVMLYHGPCYNGCFDELIAEMQQAVVIDQTHDYQGRLGSRT